MGKLLFAVIMALLLPLLYAFGARAEQIPVSARAETGMQYDHYRAWSQTSDPSTLTPAEQQRLRLRQNMTDSVGQMRDMYRMMKSQSRHIATAGGLVSAAENILDASNQSADYYSLENYNQQLKSLRQSMQVLLRL